MLSLTDIERAAEVLLRDQQERLYFWLAEQLYSEPTETAVGHSVLDIRPVSLGGVRKPLGPDEDLLGEMLEKHS